jgi:hypothetical protein
MKIVNSKSVLRPIILIIMVCNYRIIFFKGVNMCDTLLPEKIQSSKGILTVTWQPLPGAD